MTDQAMSASDTAPPAICRNCRRPLTGAWCSGCGQRHSARMLTLRELFSDVISEFLTWDSKMMRSVRPLLFQPGFLTNEYLAGRRTRYILPTRLYIIISIIVFFLLLMFGIFFLYLTLAVRRVYTQGWGRRYSSPYCSVLLASISSISPFTYRSRWPNACCSARSRTR